MKRLLFLLAALALTGAAAAADTRQAGAGPAARSYYFWLHPKLGMVKVDRATQAMVVSGKRQPAAATR